MSATKRWTAEEVRALMDESRPTPRYELIDGELLVSFADEEPGVTNAPTMEHQRAVRELLRTLGDHAGTTGCGEALASPADLELEAGTVVQPDVFVIPAHPPASGWAAIRALLLAVEVLSPNTARHDRITKRRFYQRAGVPEYWVVDVSSRLVERWRPDDERPEILDRAIAWHPAGAAAPLVIDLEAFFRRVHRED